MGKGIAIARPYSSVSFTRETEEGGDGDVYSFLAMFAGIFGIISKMRAAALACAAFCVLLGVNVNFSSPTQVRQLLSCIGVAVFCGFGVYIQPQGQR
ncbi:hypothetical protein M9434_001466 [Picochlorum sp. BPE23]|jgi:hypothetical protein|nr:hypothetical protein M9434_001466 [Picochlorum sp. BPE23]KAI8110181.1 hypothetical protein M9435_001860 [Picochlorum sp. BPE23]|mmetsp:Transcript_13558/g.27072  ORF Transcript_13558/g.27072 Transcript_13558/m.27072 type:complete len:97 (-) Transcript_13558:2147-2437(-)